MRNLVIIILIILGGFNIVVAQPSQTVRGVIVDADTKLPLNGATVIIYITEGNMGGVSNQKGEFKIQEVPVGRRDIAVTMVGYETRFIKQVDLKSGKELVLNVSLTEKITTAKTTVVTAKRAKEKPLNDMATVSARTFSVEETKRYAAAAFDPARMAQNFAGVTSGGDDMFNEIVVRGNSPKGILWRLEGVEIPNPNHFSGGAGQGGAISMLSSSTLSTSDFFTGAFPSEYGNALSGVFDLHLRKGNNETREGSFMLGALGIELSTEGPFKKGYRGSYLINYRYSTLDFLNVIGLSPTGDLVPKYQDLSFNVFLPTEKAGDFSIFGLGGNNDATYYSSFDAKDTSLEVRDDYDGFTERQALGTVGLKHMYRLNEKSYLKTVVVASSDQYIAEDEELKINGNNELERFVEFWTTNKTTSERVSVLYNRKVNAKNTVRVGAIGSRMGYDFSTHYFDFEEDTLYQVFKDKQHTYMMQSYVQWKHRINPKWTLNSGFHYTYLDVNKAMSFEPRLGIRYAHTPRTQFSAAVGRHSKPEHIALYYYQNQKEGELVNRPNKTLGFTKATHFVLGLDQRLSKNARLKVEAYYQGLTNVPVADDKNGISSTLNASSFWDIVFNNYAESDTLVNKGTGQNMGIDITVERFFENDYYFLVTGSVFNSTYTAGNGKKYNTRFNGKYQVNLLGGKEFKLKKNKTFGINGKLNFYGGNRFTPFDLTQSLEQGEGVRDLTQPFAGQVTDYFRFDVGLSYKINRNKTTHTILLDVQNTTNRENPGGVYYDSDSNSVKSWTMTGLFPFFNYRIEF